MIDIYILGWIWADKDGNRLFDWIEMAMVYSIGQLHEKLFFGGSLTSDLTSDWKGFRAAAHLWSLVLALELCM